MKSSGFKRPLLILLGAAVASLLALLLLQRHAVGGIATEAPVTMQPTANAPSAASPPAATAARAAASRDAQPLLQQVPGWQDADVDGDIRVDAQGRVIGDVALRQLFDYLLSANGQLDAAQMRAKLRALAAARGLNEAQIAQLETLFGHYYDYAVALQGLRPVSDDPGDLRAAMAQRDRLRRDMLGSEVAAGFFADTEALDAYAMQQMEIRRDPALSDAQRRQRLDELREQAPQAEIESSEASRTVAELAAHTDQLRRAGASEAQLQAYREQRVGVEAAARLQALDQQRAAWDQRMQSLRAQRSLIVASRGLSDQDKQREIDALIARDFTTPGEATRARALIGLTPAP
ncbi:lipase secretion chaperone [Hydrocarboniphaga sp.]|uniref:lipase secretion chaperone n=1 Tax=Hydrocarboniphaga sp. TaxID=2033016 RepID=UPI003D1014C4